MSFEEDKWLHFKMMAEIDEQERAADAAWAKEHKKLKFWRWVCHARWLGVILPPLLAYYYASHAMVLPGAALLAAWWARLIIKADREY